MNLIEFPSPPIAVVDFSPAPVLSIALPSVPVSVLPAGFIPTVPLFTGITASGVGSGAVAVAAAITLGMTGSGVGGVQVSPRGVVAATASGSGKMTAPAYVVGQVFPTSIEAEGSGAGSVVPSAGTSVAAAGAGTLTASPKTSIAATGQGSMSAPVSGITTATATGTGSSVTRGAARTTAASTGTGTSTVSASTYSSQKMVKSGSYNLPSNLSYENVTGWAAASTHSSTVVVGNLGLAVKAGIPVTVSATVLRSGTNTGNRARIIDTEGNEIAQATSGSPITIAPVTYTPSINTVLRVQAYANSGLGGNKTIPDDPATQLTVTV